MIRLSPQILEVGLAFAWTSRCVKARPVQSLMITIAAPTILLHGLILQEIRVHLMMPTHTGVKMQMCMTIGATMRL